MSQHIVKLECKKVSGQVRVQLGWDKPMGEYYLVVYTESDGASNTEEELVYSNLGDPHCIGQDLDYFKGVARNLGCEVPDSMWRAAYHDRERNVVNRIVFYTPTGEVEE